MTAKHTKGVWSTNEAEHDAPYQDIEVYAGGRSICRVWMDDAPVHDFNAEQIANAHLIAAAPELLNMLRRWHEAEYGFGLMPTQADVEAVIAKATK